METHKDIKEKNCCKNCYHWDLEESYEKYAECTVIELGKQIIITNEGVYYGDKKTGSKHVDDEVQDAVYKASWLETHGDFCCDKHSNRDDQIAIQLCKDVDAALENNIQFKKGSFLHCQIKELLREGK